MICSRHARPRPRLAALPRPRWASTLPALAMALVITGPVAAACLDEEAADVTAASPASPASTTPMPPAEPRVQMLSMVREALARSQAVGASALLASAALSDIEEMRAAKAVQASLGGGIGPGGSRANGVTEQAAAQVRAGINISQLLYDGGRTDRLVDWRTQLADSSRYGHLNEQEQLALTTVTLALERSRARMQVQVYRQNVRKMGCLVEALDSIVRTDRGRASELAQARKALEQAELAQSQSQSAVRQVEVRLRRLVGDGLAGTEGLATVFSNPPSQEQLLADVERAYDIAQLGAQATAASRYAEAVAAGSGVQLSWSASTTATVGLGSSGNGSSNTGTPRSGVYSVGLTVNVPLLSPGVAPASDAARKRAQAAVLQRADVLESKRYRVAEVWEQSQAAMDRARRLAEVLRTSEQVRNYTLQQWQQLGRRSLFDVMGAESEHYNLRVAYVNALHDVQELNANLLSLGRGVNEWMR